MAAWCRRLRSSLEEDKLCELVFFRLGCPGFVGGERLFGTLPDSGLDDERGTAVNSRTIFSRFYTGRTKQNISIKTKEQFRQSGWPHYQANTKVTHIKELEIVKKKVRGGRPQFCPQTKHVCSHVSSLFRFPGPNVPIYNVIIALLET